MNKLSLLKKAVLTLAIAVITVLGAANVYAAQIDYNNPNNQPIPDAVFNAYTNVNGGVGNEADFVKLRKSNGTPTVPASENNFIDPVNATCTVGEMFDVRTYIHNSANTEFNDNGNGTAVAHNVNVAMKAPLGVSGKNFTFSSTLTGSRKDGSAIPTITDTGKLNCGNNVQLRLVPSKVMVYSSHVGWTNAPDSAVNGNLPVGSRVAGSGTQWGCWDDRIIVVYVVEVVEVPKTPVYQCDGLKVEKLGERKYGFGIRYTATNGATLKTVKYNFGDGESKTVGTPFTTEYQYAKAGTYKVTTDLTFVVNGTDKVVTDAKCAAEINTGVEPCPTNPKYPKDSPECQPCPYNTNLPKDSEQCAEVPSVIPSTGAGSVIGGAAALSAATYGGYSLLQKRRMLKK